MEDIQTTCNEIEPYGILPPSLKQACIGYKETKVIWLSSNTMLVDNNDVPINGDVAAALSLVPELFRRAKINSFVDEFRSVKRKK